MTRPARFESELGANCLQSTASCSASVPQPRQLTRAASALGSRGGSAPHHMTHACGDDPSTPLPTTPRAPPPFCEAHSSMFFLFVFCSVRRKSEAPAGARQVCGVYVYRSGGGAPLVPCCPPGVPVIRTSAGARARRRLQPEIDRPAASGSWENAVSRRHTAVATRGGVCAHTEPRRRRRLLLAEGHAARARCNSLTGLLWSLQPTTPQTRSLTRHVCHWRPPAGDTRS